MADKFEKMAYVSRDGYCFEIVWKWGCDGVVVEKGKLWLENIVFDSREQARFCLKGPYRITLFYEEESYGERYPGYSNATVTFNDRFDLYEFEDDKGRAAVAKLVPRTVILWED